MQETAIMCMLLMAMAPVTSPLYVQTIIVMYSLAIADFFFVHAYVHAYTKRCLIAFHQGVELTNAFLLIDWNQY